ncbi:MAG: VWA domain-containing protein [Deltaproteobacteria bacterium]|nr:MAG: VWA domain-containing protein [Deltaproteobacteria bacterium]
MNTSTLRVLPLTLILATASCGGHRAPLEADSSPDLNQRSTSTIEADGREVVAEEPAQVEREVARSTTGARSETTQSPSKARVEGDTLDLSDGPATAEPEPAPSRTTGSVATRHAPSPDVMVDEEAYGGSSAAVGRSALSERRARRAPSRPAELGAVRPTTRPAPAPRVESGGEQFTNHGVRDVKLTRDDRMATFSIDVDTASYTITRRKLRSGHLPPTAAVRVEEFVNYFPYEYQQPKEGEPFAVDVEAAPSPYTDNKVLMSVGVQGRHVSYDQRKPVNLTFLVDVSGSMRGPDRIDLVKKSIMMLTDELEDGDTLAIATYASGSKVLLDPTPVSERARIERAVNGLHAGGSTAMSAGIELAYGLAERSFQPGSVNRVIIASDGDANVGQTSHSALSEMIRAHADRGITLTTLGFGNGNYKDTRMERLANDGDGNYYYIDSMQESRRLFVDKLSSTLENIAKDVKLQVDFDPNKVRSWRLIGYENRHLEHRDFRDDKVDAGEVGSGHQVTALFELELEEGSEGKLGEMRVRSKAPGPDNPSVERSYALDVGALPAQFDDASRQLKIQAAVAGFAELLRASPPMQDVSMARVLQLAQDGQRQEYPEDAELIDLIERAMQLKGDRAFSWR